MTKVIELDKVLEILGKREGRNIDHANATITSDLGLLYAGQALEDVVLRSRLTKEARDE